MKTTLSSVSTEWTTSAGPRLLPGLGRGSRACDLRLHGGLRDRWFRRHCHRLRSPPPTVLLPVRQEEADSHPRTVTRRSGRPGRRRASTGGSGRDLWTRYAKAVKVLESAPPRLNLPPALPSSRWKPLRPTRPGQQRLRWRQVQAAILEVAVARGIAHHVTRPGAVTAIIGRCRGRWCGCPGSAPGGDGTLSTTAEPCATAPPVIVVPAGTRNHFALDRARPRRSCRRSRRARRRPRRNRVDVGPGQQVAVPPPTCRSGSTRRR